ncbi:KAP family P-loop NTPase fold protein [Paraburkholderia fungorum]|uniref:KAP-like P-loop ATPase n=1 Tax=Paraburkholderia fungorum TaxID=134537 RepID=A0AAW3V1S1_9BURK|nr:P-loop NTPase fold protein [Paraburkholderia fungorum]MBB4516016.1 putative KAP-like P-loop ATPase [Paraburkholderia fungorum]MBB6204879.1 putative KAP-like P-loop ATPase [Paraburkholderia fungorum]
MWQDIEAEVDLLNFGVVARAAADLIRQAGGAPLTIGVSGGWGAGKSTLVKLIKADLEAAEVKGASDSGRYVVMEFNAWLYQGYEDARQALLQAVSDRLLAEAQKRKTLVDKALDIVKRVRLLKVARVAAPMFTHIGVGSVAGGPIGAFLGAATGLVKGLSDEAKRDEQLKALKDAYAELKPELQDLIAERHEDSLPKEIDALREAFAKLLADMGVTLVVFVDDLDRCLPHTAIATLEAMRLLLHVKNSAFVIAADESMIRGAVRAHFAGVDIENGLVTSYFDKLIQIPLKVPRLGVNEVKVYLGLLMAELAVRQGQLTSQAQAQGQYALLQLLKTAWGKGITRDELAKGYGGEAKSIASSLDIADQLAPLLVSASDIAGNPRLIKRFLNNLMIRLTIAKAMSMPIAIEQLVKVQLLERVASPAAFEYFVKAVASSLDGKAEFLEALEAAAQADQEYVPPHPSWATPFYQQWVRLSPRLAGSDLRALLHLSRDRSLGLAAYDELSEEAKRLLEATMQAKEVSNLLVSQLTALGQSDVSRILTRVIRKARDGQWDTVDLVRCFNCTEAHPELGDQFVQALEEIPPAQRPFAILPKLKSKPWATLLLADWRDDPESSEQVKTYLKKSKGGK